MKILFIAPEPPRETGGGSQRMFYLLRYLSELGVEIDLVTLTTESNFKNIEAIKGYCHAIYPVEAQKNPSDKWKNLFLLRAYHHYPKFQAKVNDLLQQNTYTLIHVEKFQMADYVLKVKDVPIIIDLWATSLDGAWYDVKLSKGLFNKLILLTRLFRYGLSDEKHYKTFNNFMTVSKKASDFITSTYNNKKVYVVPQGTVLQNANGTRITEENSIIFTGDMSFFPNVDASIYFAKKIYPLIKKECPAAKFYIVGANPIDEIKQLANEDSSIVVTGFVDDVREYLEKCAVYVVPIRGGSGVRTKILEAFGVKKAMVTTSIALEGIDVKDGEEVLVADQPQDFANRVLKLLNDQKLREEMGEKALAKVQNQYQWKTVIQGAYDSYQNLLEGVK